MPDSAPPADGGRPATGAALLLSAIGLLLTVTVVNGFGLDLANDTVGYVLVAAGSLSRRGRTPWWWALASVSAVAAVVQLFVYGGPASHIATGSDGLWESMFFASNLLAGAVVALLAMSLRTKTRDEGRSVVLLTIAVTASVLTLASLSIRLLGAGIRGPGHYLLEMMVVLNGLLALVLVVVTFLAIARRE